ncbi:phage tail protein [Methylomonas sp. EFPC1]|uniref:phage tail protein n=1 Tax=Methylomonas sp. EFPC1 TaxID=2812647 RepID=UPI00196725F3|nr:phage tail protein [Methylomonas sp. EFPC1]QSB00832.1 phage tail protein [Methylomonas sp. EFPC1]
MVEVSEFVAFRFKVNLYNSDQSSLLCSGYFSEVTGFEATMEPKVINEGGHNWGEHHRCGPTKFAPIILKRGVTDINDLWSWFDITTSQANYGYRLSGEIIVFGNPSVSGGNVTDNAVLVWKLNGVLPTKFKGPDLSATASQVAIEELQLVHQGLELQRPAPASTQGRGAA